GCLRRFLKKGSQMRRLYYCLGALAMLLGVTSQAAAGTITLTFEGLQDQEPINDFYNGGFGGKGSGPGPSYGIVFTPDSLALIARSAGGNGAFANNPSGVTVAFFLQGAGDTMNVAAGFTTGFSFFYSASLPGTAKLYDDLN